MAVLIPFQSAELRRAVAAQIPAVTYQKAAINAALQAIEDWFEGNRASLGVAIETAAPSTFTAAQKLAMVKWWLSQKFERGG